MVVFAWSGFPQYAARCVGSFVKSSDEPVAVVATRPRVPIAGMEAFCGCKVYWVDGKTSDLGLRESGTGGWEIAINDQCLMINDRKLTLFVSGWGIPVFNRLRDIVRARGGRVIAMVDNNSPPPLFDLRRPQSLSSIVRNAMCWCWECMKALRFRLFFRSKYNGFFVPGASGMRLLRFYGVPEKNIQRGMYSADASLFKVTTPITQRPRRMLYVGQICERKNVKMLVAAFQDALLKFHGKEFYGRDNGEWSLELYGCGPQEELIRRMIAEANSSLDDENDSSSAASIAIHPFVQPKQLAEVYDGSRVFILPSKEEHWGVVVHEAALSGCVLLASSRIGAAEDFVSDQNGRLFDSCSFSGLSNALLWAMRLSDEECMKASVVSVEMAAHASLERFVNGCRSLIGGRNV